MPTIASGRRWLIELSKLRWRLRKSPSYPSGARARPARRSEILAYLYPADAQSFRLSGRGSSRAALDGRRQLPERRDSGIDSGEMWEAGLWH